MDDHTILVAFNVRAESRSDAHQIVMGWLGPPPPRGEWWVAEDDREDGSDNDSAVFVTPGFQHGASAFLRRYGYTPAHNEVPAREGRFTPVEYDPTD